MPNHPETLPSPCRTMLPQTKEIIEQRLAGTEEKLEGLGELTDNDGDLSCRQLRDGLFTEAIRLRNLLLGAMVVEPPRDPHLVGIGTKITLQLQFPGEGNPNEQELSVGAEVDFTFNQKGSWLPDTSPFGRAIMGLAAGANFVFLDRGKHQVTGTVLAINPLKLTSPRESRH